MQKFEKITTKCLPVINENVDTDQIIPARFLVSIKKTGYGENLFADWRYNQDGSPKPEFVLNDPKYKGHEILVAGNNFGCGSSREHAAWAILQAGFKVVISSMFSDIFRTNSFKNGLLVIEIPKEKLDWIFDQIKQDAEFEITVDLENEQIKFRTGEPVAFKIDPFRKKCLINGYDELGYMLAQEDKIKAYENEFKK